MKRFSEWLEELEKNKPKVYHRLLVLYVFFILAVIIFLTWLYQYWKYNPDLPKTPEMKRRLKKEERFWMGVDE